MDVEKYWSWVILAAAFTANALVGGVMFSFGILYLDFMDRLHSSNVETIAIGAIAFGCACFTVPIAVALTKAIGYRCVAVCGGAFGAIGMLLGCIVPTIHYFYISFGILLGAAHGMVFTASISAVEDYLPRRLDLAIIVPTCGLYAGMFIFCIITRVLLDEFAYFGNFLILSAVIMNAIACGLVLRPLQRIKLLNVKTKTYEQITNPIKNDYEKSLDTNRPYDEGADSLKKLSSDSDKEKGKLKSAKDLNYKAIEGPTESIVVSLATKSWTFSDTSLYEEFDDSNESDSDQIKESLPNDMPAPAEAKPARAAAQIDETIAHSNDSPGKCAKILQVVIGVQPTKRICDANIILYLLASFVFSIGYGIPICLYPTLSQEYGLTEHQSLWTLCLLGLGSGIGAILDSLLKYVLQRRSTNAVLIFLCAATLCAGVTIAFMHLIAYWALYFTAFIFGITSVQFHIMKRTLVASGFPYDIDDSIKTLSSWCCGLGFIPGLTIAGCLRDSTLTFAFAWSFVMSALCLVISSILLFVLFILIRYYRL